MVEYFVHGIHVVVDSEWPRFLEYLALNLGRFSPPRPTTEELRVAVSVRRKRWFPSVEPERPRTGAEEQWGDDLVSDGRGVRFRSGVLDVEFDPGPPPTARATYLLDRRNRLAGFARDVPTWEEIQRVARFAAYLPLFHLIERSGTAVLHAAAVAGRNGAVVLAGLNGSGKSTLCWSLLDRLAYMSDNYVLWTGTDVLGFPESPRIPLSHAPRSASARPSVWGKRIVPVDDSRVRLSEKPRALVFLTLGRETTMTSLTESEAARRLEIIQDMTAEFPRYGYLGPISPARSSSAIRSLTGSVPAYALSVGDPATARARILDLAGDPERAPTPA